MDSMDDSKGVEVEQVCSQKAGATSCDDNNELRGCTAHLNPIISGGRKLLLCHWLVQSGLCGSMMMIAVIKSEDREGFQTNR